MRDAERQDLADGIPVASVGTSEPGPNGTSLSMVGRSTTILAVGSVVGQILAILRELYLAAQVGISADLDALLVALVLPTTLASVLATGLATALIPAYLDLRVAAGVGAARRLSGLVVFWVTAIGVLLTVAMLALSEAIIGVVGPGLSQSGQEMAEAYLTVLGPIGITTAVAAIIFAVLQSEQHFVPLALSGVVSAGTTLVVVLVLWPSDGLWAFALGSLLGPIAALIILVVATGRHGVSPRLTLWGRDLGVRAMVAHAVPLSVSQAVVQMAVVGDRAVASLLAPGSISALRYGEALVRLPLNAIGSAWGGAIYPALVRSTRETETGGLGASSGVAIRYAIALFLPLAMLTAAAAPSVVSVAYGRGAFDDAELRLTAQVLAAFAPLVAIIMISAVMTSALNARRRGRVLLMGGILHTVLTVSLNILLGFMLGVVGIALSASITYATVTVFFARILAASDSEFRLRSLTRALGLSTAAATPSCLIVGTVAWTGMVPSDVAAELAFLLIGGLVVMVTYLAIARRIGFEEPVHLSVTLLDRGTGGRMRRWHSQREAP